MLWNQWTYSQLIEYYQFRIETEKEDIEAINKLKLEYVEQQMAACLMKIYLRS